MPLAIYLDESVPVAVTTGLKRRGVAAVSALEAGNLGLSDMAQLQYAQTQKQVIFTHDADFLRLAATVETHGGIIYAHQTKYTLGICIQKLKECALQHEMDALWGRVVFL